MKVAIFFLCLLPPIVGEKKALLGNILNKNQIGQLVNAVVKSYGTNANTWQCQKECLVLFTNHVLDLGCDITCKGIQSLIQKMYHTPSHTTTHHAAVHHSAAPK